MSDAKKYFYFIFFSGSGRTYQFQLRRFWVLTLGTVLVGGILWAAASIAALTYLAKQHSSLIEDLLMARERLFYYQSQLELTYEQAYPSLQDVQTQPPPLVREHSIGLPLWSTAPSHAATDAPSIASEETDRAEASQTAAVARQEESATSIWDTVTEDHLDATNLAESSAGTSAHSAASTATNHLHDQSVYGLKVAIEEVNIQFPNQLVMQLSFVIRNTGGQEPVRGHVYALATFSDQAGRKHILTAPGGQTLEDSSSASRRRPNAESFLTRRFRPAQFQFATPEGLSGTFTYLEIMVHDREGGLLDHFSTDLRELNIARDQSRGAEIRRM